MTVEAPGEAGELHRILFDVTPIPSAVVDGDGCVLEWNGAAERLFGWAAREAIGRPLPVVPPARRHEWGATQAAALAGDRVVEVALECVSRDGRPLDIALSAAPVPDGEVTRLLLVFADATARVADAARWAAALRISEERFRGLVESNPIGLCFWRDTGEITDANDALLSLLGLSRDALAAGLDWRGLVVPEHRHRTELALAEIRAHGHSTRYEVDARRADGSTVPILVAGAYLGDPADGVGVSWVVDISDRKRVEAVAIDNARLYEVAQRARESAESASRAKEEFLSVVSHELRTPLATMTNWLRVLQTDTGTHRVRAMAAIDRAARAQAKLVEDLLDVSRIVSGGLRLEPRPVELHGVVRTAFDAIMPAAAAKGVVVRLEADGGAPQVAGDPDRLQQVVWNLLSNAVKFTPHGGHVDVRIEHGLGEARVVVRDSGRGISARFLPHVFESFQQEDPAATRHQGGLGLGLAIVRHLVELHGGSVAAASAGEGFGSTFTVVFPTIDGHPPGT